MVYIKSILRPPWMIKWNVVHGTNRVDTISIWRCADGTFCIETLLDSVSASMNY